MSTVCMYASALDKYTVSVSIEPPLSLPLSLSLRVKYTLYKRSLKLSVGLGTAALRRPTACLIDHEPCEARTHSLLTTKLETGAYSRAVQDRFHLLVSHSCNNVTSRQNNYLDKALIQNLISTSSPTFPSWLFAIFPSP